jgi:iron complex outermembrane receptor protein
MRLLPAILCSASIGAISLAMASTSALAQTATPAPAASADTSDAIAEVVVTSRRSAERLQDVPLAITAQTSTQLVARGITDLQGVSRYTPGLQFKDFVTSFNGSATIRGLAQANVQNAVGNVGTFIDGIYLQRGYLVNTSLGDWDRIEVVKGPQSALYGANTFSGAINYVTHEPDTTPSGNAQVTVGDAQRSAQVAVGGPIVDGLLYGRIFVAKSQYDGTWDNNLPGATGVYKKFGANRRDAISGALKFTPTDNFKAGVYYTEVNRTEYLKPYYEVDGTFTEDKLNCGPNNATTGRPSLFCGTLPTNPDSLRSGVGSRPEGLFAAEEPPAISKTRLLRASADWEINSDWSLHYLAGFVKGSASEDFSFASNTYNPTGKTTISQQHEGGVIEYSSHDLRLAYDPGGAFKADVGVFHSRSDDHFVFGIRLVAPGKTLTRLHDDPTDMTGMIAYTNTDAIYDTDAMFARASYKFLDDKATISAEGRYSKTDVSFNDILGRAAVSTRPLLTNSFKNFTPRVTAEYRYTGHNLLYASAAKGVKAGGFNGYVSSTTVLTTAEQSFGQESNWTYELGSKNSFLDGKMILNASLFYVDWTNKQTSVVPSNYTGTVSVGATPPSIYASTGDATAKGIEIDGQYRPFHPLTFTFSANYTDAKYAKGSISPGYIGLCTGTTICPATGDISGNQLEGSPKFSTAVGAEYRDRLTGEWDYFAGADLTYQNKQMADPMGLVQIAGYTLVDGRLGVDNGKIRAFFWGKNLFDKEYIQNTFIITSLRQYAPSFGERRTLGVTVAASF